MSGAKHNSTTLLGRNNNNNREEREHTHSWTSTIDTITHWEEEKRSSWGVVGQQLFPTLGWMRVVCPCARGRHAVTSKNLPLSAGLFILLEPLNWCSVQLQETTTTTTTGAKNRKEKEALTFVSPSRWQHLFSVVRDRGSFSFLSSITVINALVRNEPTGRK